MIISLIREDAAVVMKSPDYGFKKRPYLGADNVRYVKASVAPSAKEFGLRMLPGEAPEAKSIEMALPDDAGSEVIPPRHGWIQQLLVDPYALGRDVFEGDLRLAVQMLRDRSISSSLI